MKEYMAPTDVPIVNSADPDERAPIRALSSGSTLFARSANVVIAMSLVNTPSFGVAEAYQRVFKYTSKETVMNFINEENFTENDEKTPIGALSSLYVKLRMEIYFCGSISGGREDRPYYHSFIEHLKQYGKVLDEHVGTMLNEHEPLTDQEIFDRDVAWLKKSDVVVAEVTHRSAGVGYELGRAVEMKKPTLCLFRENAGNVCTPMIIGSDDGHLFFYRKYKTEKEALDIIDTFMSLHGKGSVNTK